MRKILVVAVGLTTLLLAACGGGDGDDNASVTPGVTGTPQPSQPATGGISGVVVTADHAVGANRFSVGLIDSDSGDLVLDADVSLTFLKVLSGGQAEIRSEADATPVVMDRFYIDDATGQQIGGGQIAVFAAQVEFDEMGDWGVQITGFAGDRTIEPITLAFEVRDPEDVLSVGDPAPGSRQTVIGDVADVSEIDTMSPTDPLHDITIEDAVTSGSPSVIAFVTPAFCETLTCGPVLQSVVLPLYEQYKDEANFIHVEPYFVEEARTGRGFCSVPAFNIDFARTGVAEGPGPCPALTEGELEAAGESWNLTIEPVVFVVDSDGNIAGKFEAVVSIDEIEVLLKTLIP